MIGLTYGGGKNKSLDRPIGAAETNGLSISLTLFLLLLLLARSMLLQAFHLQFAGIYILARTIVFTPNCCHIRLIHKYIYLHCTVFWKSFPCFHQGKIYFTLTNPCKSGMSQWSFTFQYTMSHKQYHLVISRQIRITDFYKQSNSVITNTTGPTKFVRYKRINLCSKMII